MLKTVLALVLSTGLVACVTDDSDLDTQDRAYDPDQLPDDNDGNAVRPNNLTENPSDVPGQIPAPIQGTPHTPTQNLATTDFGFNHGEHDSNVVVTGESTQDVALKRGVADTTQLGGNVIGDTCEGREMNCRIAAPARAGR